MNPTNRTKPPESAPPVSKVTAGNASLKRRASAFQNVVLMNPFNDQSIKPAASKIQHKDGVSPERSAGKSPADKRNIKVFQSVAPQRVESSREDHRGLMGKRPPPQKDLDPLSTFMMLRSQLTTSSAAAEAQTSTRAPGKLRILLWVIKIKKDQSDTFL